MTAMSNNHGRRILVAWAVVLGLAAALTAAGNVATAWYAAHVRDQRPETYIAEAEKLMNRGDMPGAFQQWEEAHRRGPNLPEVHKVLGDIHYNLQHWDQALTAYRKALALGSPSVGARMNILWALVELGRYPEALAFARDCVAAGVTDPELYRRTAEACFRGKMFMDAVEFYETALTHYPNDLYLMERLRLTYQAIGDDPKAKAMETAIVQVQATLSRVRGSAS
jgi:tetratricopeptide (TPR) repeat protein